MLTFNSLAPSHTTSGIWPTVEQGLLIRAAISAEPEAIKAFEQWRALADPTQWQDAQAKDAPGLIDHSTLRLLPLLHNRIHIFNGSGALNSLIANVYLDSWLRLNRNLSYMLPLLRLLQENSIDTLFLKGAPLAYEYYPLPATRPMVDFDVLIKSTDIQRAIDVLAKAGWHPTRKIIPGDFRFRHSQSFINAQGVEFDFHWHVMNASCNLQADSAFWQHSLPFDLTGVATRRLDATDSLLHTLVHGVHAFAWHTESAIRWIPDSMLILQKDADTIAWDRIVSFAIHYRLTHRLTLALGYLQKKMAAQIPVDVTDELSAHRVTMLERLEHRHRKPVKVAIDDPSKLSSRTSIVDKSVQYLRYRRGAGSADSNAPNDSGGVLSFITFIHRVRSIREVVTIYARKMASAVLPRQRN